MILKESPDTLKLISIALMAPKKRNIILTMVLASLLSASSAGGHRKLMNVSNIQAEGVKELPRKLGNNEKAFDVRSRVLVVKTNDYGSYNPAPKLAKPGFKNIPN